MLAISELQNNYTYNYRHASLVIRDKTESGVDGKDARQPICADHGNMGVHLREDIKWTRSVRATLKLVYVYIAVEI